MSTKTESPVNRFPNARAHNEDEAVAPASAPPPDANHTSAGLPADALSNKQDLATRPPRMQGTSQGFLDSRHVTQRSATKACVHSSCYFEASSRPSQLLRIKSVWCCLALSFLLLLLTPLVLTMVDDEISSVASVLSTGNNYLIVGFLVAVLSIVVGGFAMKIFYTPATGVMRAFKRYQALCLSWQSVYKVYNDMDQDEKMVDTKRKIDSTIADLNKKINDLDTAVWWEKLAMLHWGTSAVRAYDKQYDKLKTSIDVFKWNAEIRNTKHFPPPPGPTEV
ncbi:hypothetical protein B0H11DRAFT_1933310 [Mycena galericulata]|nr:hypothetical protein B0H11DRAFT_1933310 [Mycena galericulata]